MGRVNCHTHATTPLRATPSRRAGDGIYPSAVPQPYSAPRSLQQPTLARGCEAEPAARSQSTSANRLTNKLIGRAEKLGLVA